MKKGLKILLIVGGSLLVAGGARAGLTKAGVIPNWLGIEVLYGCVDCDGKYFNTMDIPKINGINCCKGTYSNLRDLWRAGYN